MSGNIQLASPTTEPLRERRARRLFDELSFAVSRTDLATSIGKGAWGEISNLIKATGQGAALEHVGDRTAAAIDGSIALGIQGKAERIDL